MKSDQSIAFIGYGVMAEAMITGLIHNQVASPKQIRASGPRQDRADELREKYGIQTTTDNVQAAQGADVVVLSVKPQRLPQVLAGLCGKISPQALVLSIVAGGVMDSIAEKLNHDRIVRAMPNTPAQIGEGITVWCASPAALPEQRALAQEILCALGQEVFVEEETYLDMATALSGTGPAYIFLFLEAMIDSGVHLGLPRRIAQQLVVQTVRGSVDFFDQSKMHPAAMRNQVTSPGGTSAEALYYLEKAGFRTAISRAIWAAYERSQELGKGRPGRTPEKPASES
ncbi:MAG: pyrroline-5-carboxylate reductase [Anaerolineaceae bacterium]